MTLSLSSTVFAMEVMTVGKDDLLEMQV